MSYNYAGFSKACPYLDFEAEYIDAEMVKWRNDPSEQNRLACLAKRIQAKAEWEKMGNVVPSQYKFSTH